MNMIASTGQLRASYIRWALLFVPAIMLLGVLSGQLSGSGPDNPWFVALVKPALFPPPSLFGIVWSLLYGMMGFALAMIVAARGASLRGVAVMLFIVQLCINLAWSPVFFGAHQITTALALLIALDLAVLITFVLFWKVRILAGVLLLPYLAWIAFATYLTWEIRDANPTLDGHDVSGAVQRLEF